MRIKNLTPHDIVLLYKDTHDVIVRIPPSGIIARAEQEDVRVGVVEVEGRQIPVVRSTFGEGYNLPEYDPTAEVAYGVSSLTARAAKGRPDLLIASGSVRDPDGKIIGITQFATV